MYFLTMFPQTSTLVKGPISGSLTRTDAFWNMGREIKAFTVTDSSSLKPRKLVYYKQQQPRKTILDDQKIAIYPSTPSHTLNPTITTRRDPGFSSLLLSVPIFLYVFLLQSVLPKHNSSVNIHVCNLVCYMGKTILINV